MIARRAFLTAIVTSALACSKRAATDRCGQCGMKIDPASPWRAEIVTTDGKTLAFDTPRCALTALRRGQSGALRVQEYYERAWVPAEKVAFVVGSDVVGPMGADLVPVDAARAAKFSADHAAERTLALDAVTLDVLDTLK